MTVTERSTLSTPRRHGARGDRSRMLSCCAGGSPRRPRRHQCNRILDRAAVAWPNVGNHESCDSYTNACGLAAQSKCGSLYQISRRGDLTTTTKLTGESTKKP